MLLIRNNYILDILYSLLVEGMKVVGIKLQTATDHETHGLL